MKVRKKGSNNTFIKIIIFTAALYSNLWSSETDSVFLNDTDNMLSNSSLTIFVIPVKNLKVRYLNNTSVEYERQFSDSFFIESANSLITFECSKPFSLCNSEEKFEEFIDSSEVFSGLKYSTLKLDTTEFESFTDCIKEVAGRYNADLVLFPYFCSIKHIISQQKGWRGQSSTAGPVKYRAQTNIHLQIWDKDGNLLYERVGKADTGRPVLYSIFKKRRMNRGIVAFAKHLYTSPLVKSLYKAIVEAMRIE
jgi:hypothetical protein